MRCEHTWKPRVAAPVMCPRCHSPFWNRPRRKTNPVDVLAPYARAFVLLNRLQHEGVLKRWVLFGSLAFSYYYQPIYTGDADVLVLVESRKIKSVLYQEVGHPVAPDTYYLGPGIFLQPFLVGPGQEDFFVDMRQDEVFGVPVYVMGPERLILTLLERFDPIKDWPRIRVLVPISDRRKLERLLDRYADLQERFNNLHL